MSAPGRWLAAAALAVAAFLLYDATLLPGQDLGDTASFETTITQSFLTPRQAYPLYYATGNLFVRGSERDPARGINMASAVFGALACGLMAVATAALSGCLIAGIVAGLLFAVSYTFWSQAIIAEVYALHAFMTALSLVALIGWIRRPTLWRLALFFAIYAIGFGNHLSMILLLPGFALLLLLASPGGPHSMLRPRIALLAIAMATLGASQYLWNLSYWLLDPPHPGLVELLRDFWFDVTKADWRATMVLGIPEGSLGDRFAMYWFDLRQQFGVPGVILALAGAAWCTCPGDLPLGGARLSKRRAGIGLLVLFLVSWTFAFTYNVGDVHVFYLTAHFMVAVFAGLGTAALLAVSQRTGGGRRPGWRFVAPSLALVLVAYPAWRGYDTFPAVDRSNDWQVKMFFDGLTRGLTRDNAVVAADLNWQLHNGLDYYSKFTRPDLAVFDTTTAILYVPLLVESNREIHRPMVVTNGAAPMIRGAYGPLYDLQRDDRAPAPSLAERLCGLPAGTPYVLTLLQAYPDVPVDEVDLRRALGCLAGAERPVDLGHSYNLMAGRVGQRPALVRSATMPFRLSADAADVLGVVPHAVLDARVECWLPADTIRRMGFGRVIVGRRPVLTLDRGVSIALFNADGSVKAVEYGWGLLSPQPRWIIPVKP